MQCPRLDLSFPERIAVLLLAAQERRQARQPESN